MLYTTAKKYLLDKLVEAGLKSKPYTALKSLEKSQESHVGAVLFFSEDLARNGAKRFYKDQEGAQQKRRKVFDRDITFHVVIGEYTDDAVEALFERFIKSLDRGIWDDGNFVPLEVKGSSWSDKEDSILKAEVSVEVEIIFEGGIYKDTGSYKIQDIESEITKNDGKESING